MFYKIKVGRSNHHVHLTKEMYDELFDEQITIKNNLNQKGQFSANQTVDIVTDKGILKNVRIVGPFRKYNQVELLNSDLHTLGIKAPVRASGDLKNSASVYLQTNKNKIFIDSCAIISQRHIHINTSEKEKYHVETGDRVLLHINSDKRQVVEAFVKVSDDGYYEAHLDMDDCNAFCIENDEEIILEIDK